MKPEKFTIVPGRMMGKTYAMIQTTRAARARGKRILWLGPGYSILLDPLTPETQGEIGKR